MGGTSTRLIVRMSAFGNSPVSAREAAMLSWIHDFAPYGVITTDTELRIQSWNRWMIIQSGKSAEAVIGHPVTEIFPELKERGLLPRFERALEGEVSLLSTALHSYILELPSTIEEEAFPFMQQTGRIAPLLFKNEVIGTILVIEDVTQREIQSLALRQQHERDHILSWALAHLLTSEEPRRTIRELFYKIAEYTDFDSYFLYLIPPGQDTFKLQAAGGLTPEQEERFALLDPESPAGRILLASRAPQACESLQNPSNPAAILHAEFGLTVCALLPLLHQDSQFGLLCFGTRCRDTLHRRDLDLLSTISKYLAVALQKEATSQELHRAQLQLNQHAHELERQVAERTASLCDIIAELETFSYTLSHDLRAPIRALIGYSEILIEDYSADLPRDAQGVVERLHRACMQLDGLTQDLLEFSRVSRQDIKLIPVDIEQLLKQALSLLPQAQDIIEMRRPFHSVLAHPGLLQQSVSNLLDNSLKFVKPGQPPKISVWTELRAEHPEPESLIHPGPFTSAKSLGQLPPDKRSSKRPLVRLIVQDAGIGIAPESQAKIFGVFERGNSSMQYPGSGIGLAIVARAVQRMGGSCGVESTPGMGSRFWLELPSA